MVEYRRTKWDELSEGENTESLINETAKTVMDNQFFQNDAVKMDEQSCNAPYTQMTYNEAQSFEATSDTLKGAQKATPKSGGFIKAVALVLVGALTFGSSVGFGYRYASEYLGKEKSVGAYYIQSQQLNAVNMQESADSIPALHEKLKPNIVAITNRAEISDGFFGKQSVEGSGTGVIFNVGEKDILLVTNNHVIENAQELSVAFDGSDPIDATLIGTDPDTDIAVVKVKRSDIPEEVLKTLTGVVFGDSDKIKVGESVIALGNPLGYDDTLTGGLISGVDRKLQVDSGRTLSLIQTDAAINPGNSGGALVNLKGEVIGINTVKITNTASESDRSVFSGRSGVSVEGIGFAIPINDVKSIIDELLSKGYVSKPYMGIGGKNVSKEIAAAYNLAEGIFIDNVASGSGADDAGIQHGDIITDVDSAGIKTIESLITHIREKEIGDKLKVMIDRSGDEFEVEVELRERSEVN